MSYPMFSPQQRPSSPYSLPPQKRVRNDTTPSASGINFFLPTQRHTPGAIEQNVSFTRGSVSGPLQPSEPAPAAGPLQNSESDEDARFLRLAREALVATANGAKNTDADGALLVDPTIQDLLTRLQYAASPHGNPIKRSNKITANENGQLNIQGFYQLFPNLSNDIFVELPGLSGLPLVPKQTLRSQSNHPSNQNNAGWNFLVGEPLTFKNDPKNSERNPEIPEALLELAAFDGGEDSRKFLCSKCSMSFRRSSDLKRHEKQHLTIPPNICELCGKGFARKDALKRHMGTMTCKRNGDKKLYIENLTYLRETREGGRKDDHYDYGDSDYRSYV